MYTLTEVQYIFDYAMLAFYQCADNTWPDAAFKRSAQVAAATTTVYPTG